MADLKVFVCLPNFSGGGAERVMLTLINAFSSSAEITCIVLNENGPLRKKLPRSCIVKNFKCVSARAEIGRASCRERV